MEKQRIPQGQLGIADTGWRTNTQPTTAADKDAKQPWTQKKGRTLQETVENTVKTMCADFRHWEKQHLVVGGKSGL